MANDDVIVQIMQDKGYRRLFKGWTLQDPHSECRVWHRAFEDNVDSALCRGDA